MGKRRLLYSAATSNSFSHSLDAAQSGLRIKITEFAFSMPFLISSSHFETAGISSQSTQTVSAEYPLSYNTFRKRSTNTLLRREKKKKNLFILFFPLTLF